MAEIKITNTTYKVGSLYQWDKNQTLVIYGLSLSSIPEVHFAHADMGRAIVRHASMDAAGVLTVEVPNSMLQKAYTIQVYICTYEGITFQTLHRFDIPVKARSKPEDYVLEASDSEVYSFNALENKIENMLTRADSTLDVAEYTLTHSDQLLTDTRAARDAAMGAQADAETARDTAVSGASAAQAAAQTALAACAGAQDMRDAAELAQTAAEAAQTAAEAARDDAQSYADMAEAGVLPTHAAKHAADGADPIAPAAIGAVAVATEATALPASGTALVDNTEYVATLENGYIFAWPAGRFDVWLTVTTAADFVTCGWPAGTTFVGEAPEFEAGTTYELNIKNGCVAYAEVVTAE